MNGIRILGTGRYVPELTASNADFTAIVETSDEWISTRTGMKTRHIASEAEPAWLMGREAAKLALTASGVKPGEIGLIIFTTVTPDYYTPSMACIVQRELGIPDAAAFDVNAACAGFAYALDMARRYLAEGDISHVLIVSAETNTQLVDYTDRATCVLFGDGAGAAVLSSAQTRFGSHVKAEPSGTPLIYVRKPRKPNPFVKNRPEAAFPFDSTLENGLYMSGNQVYKFATKAMPEAIEKACAKAGVAVKDLDLLIPHQANLRIIETAMKHLDLPAEKCYVNIQNYGNTSSASIAIALDECVRGGRISRGGLIGVVGFGAGLTLGACVFEF